MATLQEIRAKLKEQESRNSGTGRSIGDNSIYPFWNLKEGGESVIRFLPDANQDNTFFWVERAMIKLPFSGIKGESDNKSIQVQVPCVEMYNDGTVCPILNEVRAWFKDPSLEEMGRKYWKKRSYIFQGFVVEDGLKEESIPENPIRRHIIGPQVFQLIRAALLDPEMDNLPTDYIHGLDFRMKKGGKGGYADYSTSSWARRERPLSEKEHEALHTFGLFNLKDFLPKKPNEVELKAMKEMFEASVDGEPYDMNRWGQYFKPAGINNATGDPVLQKSLSDDFEKESAPLVGETKTKTETSEVHKTETSSGNRAEDILALIRNRKQS